jgi:hypothetical protein
MLVALVLLSAGCNDPIVDGAGESATPAPPVVEGTGPEQPAPPANDQPAIQLAKLPVGSNGKGSSRSQEIEQCVGVSWLGQPIPGGVSVRVTDIGFSSASAFSTDSDLDCPGRSCHSFTFDSRHDTADDFCSVAVRAEEAAVSADLIVKGSMRCRTGRQTCDVFIADVQTTDTSLTVTGPDELPGTGEGPDPEPDENPPPSTDAPAIE